MEQAIQEFLRSCVLEGKVRDPRVGQALFTKVTLASDFSHAKVYVIDETGDVQKGLQSAAGFLQSLIANRFRLRRTPRLHFFPDKYLQKSEHTSSLIDTLHD